MKQFVDHETGKVKTAMVRLHRTLPWTTKVPIGTPGYRKKVSKKVMK
jgi:hypothetical protein